MYRRAQTNHKLRSCMFLLISLNLLVLFSSSSSERKRALSGTKRETFHRERLAIFGRRRLKKRSEKTEIARSKRRHRKGGGQAAAKKRSPLRRMWNRGRARSAKVHACGAQLKGEFQEISRECEGARSPKVHACGAQLNRDFSQNSMP